MLLLSFVLATITYRYVEIPVRRRAATQARVVVALVGALSLIGVFGLLIFMDNGVPRRFPPELRYLMDRPAVSPKDWGNRVGECFLITNAERFKDYCTDPGFAEAKSSIFFWGDSHAAKLYFGLRERQKREQFAIAQYNLGACPPILDFKPKSHCHEINQFVFQHLQEVKPKTVILEANWLAYDLSGLDATVGMIESHSTAKVYLMGPVPQWNYNLPRSLYAAYLRAGERTLPLRISIGLDERVAEVDRMLSEKARALAVPYISPYQMMCNQDGCLARVAAGRPELTSFDYGHLTREAAILVVEQFPAQMFAIDAALPERR
jgi:hypothetical protein